MYALVDDEEDEILYSLVLALYDPRSAPPRYAPLTTLRTAPRRPVALRWLVRGMCIVALAMMVSIPSSRSPMTPRLSGAPGGPVRTIVLPERQTAAVLPTPAPPLVDSPPIGTAKASVWTGPRRYRAKRARGYARGHVAHVSIPASPMEDPLLPPDAPASRIDQPVLTADRNPIPGGGVPAPGKKQGTVEEETDDIHVDGGQAHAGQVKEALDAIRTLRLR